MYGDISQAEIDEMKRKQREYYETKPRLVLQTCIKAGGSFSLGENGSYNFWVKNAVGDRIFGIYNQPIPKEEYDALMPELDRCIQDWLAANYPDWNDYTAYWDEFPAAQAAWVDAQKSTYAIASEIIADKTDDELRALRAEIGTGLQRTNYTLTLQQQLGTQQGAVSPYRVVEAVVKKMLHVLDLKIDCLSN